jgi:hypothetical protein
LPFKCKLQRYTTGRSRAGGVSGRDDDGVMAPAWNGDAFVRAGAARLGAFIAAQAKPCAPRAKHPAAVKAPKAAAAAPKPASAKATTVGLCTLNQVDP